MKTYDWDFQMKQFTMSSFNFSSFLLGCGIALVSCVVFYSFGDRKPNLLTQIDLPMMDLMFICRGPQEDSGNIIIVDIDEKSLSQIGQWPWPYDIMTRLTHRLIVNQVRTISFHMIFSQTDRYSPHSFFKQLSPDLVKKLPPAQLSNLFND